MNIIEKFIESKTGKMSDCEDALYIGDNFISVIDGATSKNSIKVDSKTSGVYIKEIIFKALNNLNITSDSIQAINYINDIIYNEIKSLPDGFNMSASIIIYSKYKNEIWSFGDCQCLINGCEHFHQKEIDVLTASLRSEYTKKLLEIGYTEDFLLENDLGRESILPILKGQYKLINNSENKYGYPCLNGGKINSSDIIVYKTKANDEIILSSDGYPNLKRTLKESESYLAEVLIKDPLLISKYKATKGLKNGNISFDDRTYVKFIC